MNAPSDAPDEADKAPWTIRSMPTAKSGAAAAAAARAQKTIATWVGEAIDEKLARERDPEMFGVQVVRPGWEMARGPVSDGRLTVEDVGRAVEIAVRIAEIQGKPLGANARVLTGARRRLTAMLLADHSDGAGG